MSGVPGSIAEDAGGAAGVGLMRRGRLQYRASCGGRWLGIACYALLLVAGEPGRAALPSPKPVLARECLPIDSSHPVGVHLTSPADGLLRVEVQEHGISTVSSLDDAVTSAASSPIVRLGTVVLAAKVRRGESSKVDVRVADSHDIRGAICVSAQLIPPEDIVRTQAELDFAAGGRATRATQWATAFSRYLSASRGFDHLGLLSSVAMARHAMAELAYLRLDRKRDTYALTSEVLSDYGPSADPALLGELATLQAKALLDMPGVDIKVVAGEVRRWLATGRRYESSVPYGARELPWLDILQGFLEFLLDAPDPRYFVQAAASCRELKDWDCYAVASQNIAQLAEEGKNYSSALSTYADVLRRLPPGLDTKLTADIWNNLGRVQGIMGLFSASERSHTAAMQAYAQLGDCQGVRRSLARAGNLLVHVGNLADAENDLGQAASLNCASLLASTATAASPITADAVAVTARMRRDSRESSTTATNQPCAHPLDPAPLTLENKAIVFNSVLSLGTAAMLTGDGPEVWSCLTAAQSYASDARSQIRLANARGTAFLDRNDPGEARAEFKRALRIADEAGLPPTHEHRSSAELGLVKAMQLAGKAEASLPGAYEVLASSTARGDIPSTITSLQLIAAAERGSGQTATAIQVLKVAADLIEAVPIDGLDGEQRANFLASQHRVFADLTDLLAGTGADGSEWLAFEASERGRARSLRYALNQQTQDASTSVDTPSADKYRRLSSAIVGVDTAGKSVERGPKAIEEIDHLALEEGGAAGETLDRTVLARTLKQLHATLVEYASGPKEMLAFILMDEHVRIVHLGDSHEIERKTAEFRDRLRDPETSPEDVSAAAQGLARLILWPLTAYLPGGRIVFVPDDALHTVPLAALPWSGAANQLLLQHAETAVIPSASFLTHVHPAASQHSETPRIALVGDPVFRISDWRRECTEVDTASTEQHNRNAAEATPRGADRATWENRSTDRALGAWTESLPRLPGTRAEVTGIARLAHESRPQSRIETLVGCAAVPTSLRKVASADIDLLHIATHARIDAQRPRLSALALTPESPADTPASTFGLLDILGLKLNSKLVVLSACDTSRGRLLPGEGVLGPAQAFLEAGSAAVLASYWKVDDQITSTFMQRFYKYLLVDRLSASAALRKTQLDSAASGKTYEWAAFSLYGWPDSSI
jgi:CHAT domain-containing protein/tetratricopeptide (TPR) repeat protein